MPESKKTCCFTCKHCDKDEPTPFKGGMCYGYFGGRQGKLVKATDYCSRYEQGYFTECLKERGAK